MNSSLANRVGARLEHVSKVDEGGYVEAVVVEVETVWVANYIFVFFFAKRIT
jgi:hypothetical protein